MDDGGGPRDDEKPRDDVVLDRPDVLPGTRLPWAYWSDERYQESDSFVPGWGPDERDMIQYWEAGNDHEVRFDRFADGTFAHQRKPCHWSKYCGTRDVPLDRLWVVKVKHDKFVKGYLYSMCWQHLVAFKQGGDEFANDPKVPTCPVHFVRMLGGVCDQCE